MMNNQCYLRDDFVLSHITKLLYYLLNEWTVCGVGITVRTMLFVYFLIIFVPICFQLDIFFLTFTCFALTLQLPSLSWYLDFQKLLMINGRNFAFLLVGWRELLLMPEELRCLPSVVYRFHGLMLHMRSIHHAEPHTWSDFNWLWYGNSKERAEFIY